MAFQQYSQVRLGELCQVVTKGTTPTSVGLSFSDSGIPFLRVQNLSNLTVKIDGVLFISDQAHNTLKRSIIKPKDFLITIAGTIGRVAIVPDDFPECNCNQAIAILRFNNLRMLSKYLLFWFGTEDALRQISGKKVTATIPNLSLAQIKSLKIPLPPLPEQKKIAAILDAADQLKQKDQQLIEHYNRLSQSLFLDMFGDPVINPMGWDVKEFGSFIDILTDYHANGSYEVLKENVTLKRTKDYALMVRTTDLEKKNFDDDVVYISKSAYEYLSKSKVFGGEIIVSKIGSAGKVFLMPNLNIPVSLGMNAFLLRFSNNLNNLFAYYLLTSKLGDREIGKRIKGAVTKTIRKDALREIPIIAPPITLQNQFAERIKAIEAQKQQAQLNLKKSTELFNSLLQRAFLNP